MQRTSELFLFRLSKLAAISGQPLVRLCEGRFGITRREWRLIVVLSQSGPLLSTELAIRARIEPALTSRAVTQLVANGLATRVPRPNDRRRVEIHLNERARAIYAELYPTVEQLNAELLADLSQDDCAHLERIFSVLEQSVAQRLPLDELPKADRSKHQPGVRSGKSVSPRQNPSNS